MAWVELIWMRKSVLYPVLLIKDEVTNILDPKQQVIYSLADDFTFSKKKKKKKNKNFLL
jgi:hypothetical protein